jgi:hypothetical protein
MRRLSMRPEVIYRSLLRRTVQRRPNTIAVRRETEALAVIDLLCTA